MSSLKAFKLEASRVMASSKNEKKEGNCFKLLTGDESYRNRPAQELNILLNFDIIIVIVDNAREAV